MKNQLMDLSGGRAKALKMDAVVSFMPFIRFLEQRIREERTLKTSFYQTILDYFHDKNIPLGDIPLADTHLYSDFCEYIYASLSPALFSEQNLAWGLSAPLKPEIFYGTDLLYAILGRKPSEEETRMPHKAPGQYHKERMHVIYALILQRLYNFQIPVKIEQYHAWTHPDTGLLRYNQVHINVDFIEVRAKDALPALSFREVYTYFSESEGYEQLEKILPLSLFELRGFAVVTVADVTAQMAVENIKQIRFQRTDGHTANNYQDVIRSLKTLVQNNKIEFDLFPFVRVNNQAVYGYEKAGNGILFSVWGEHTLSPEAFRKQAEGYAANPISFFSPDIHGESEMQIGFLDAFRRAGVRSLVLVPLFYNKTPVGVLGMHTWLEEQFDEKMLAMLDPALSPLAQLLQIYIDEFNAELDQIIKEKFTSIQPAVQWKFNEAAWHYLHQKKKHLPASMENIHFNEVYPLYGAIDIRNSTLERNAAIRADLDHHLNLLSNTLAALQPFDRSSLMEEISYHCRKWRETLQSGALNSNDENNLSYFLNGQAHDYLMHLFRQKPETGSLIGDYLNAMDPEQGEVHRHRQALERSMQQINHAINNYFETSKEQLQQSYPCYFEKFRTDGIEYDIYIGQSIAPGKPFDHFHLKNLRLWQLSSMADIARLSHSLLQEIAKPLQTTQLIFVHNQPIDISFRADERKFDVEGAYNIRYQMIKKRIDKVHIRNSQERLTQPGTIALIYFHDRDVADYRPYISYLQETGMLAPQLDELELEDLQGLSGLKALRVNVTYPGTVAG
ncbi:GAF domain-containing protein [Taibaiella koreensis]|uniref:GAF domain-containing protein n=1 Tax=Taibaiella koreensis TaxID=1268548 RepID=UPI000E59F714|nr:GAF domain-containing protein [Taibaiella koreensis]